MVFTLPGAGGGGDLGGGGDSWDRNEGDGDWGEASDEQMERVKRLVAAREKSQVNVEDLKVSDVEEDEALFDKKTGKKLTFTFPDAPHAFSSGGRGRCNGNGQGKSRGKKKSEKNEERGEKEKDDEAKGEIEKNDPKQDKDYDSGDRGRDNSYEVTCKQSKGELHPDKFQSGGKGRCIFFQGEWMTPNEFEKVAGSRAKKYKVSLYVKGIPIGMLIDPNGSLGTSKLKSEENEERGEKEKGNEPKGEKEKNSTEKEVNEDDDDCFDLNLEDIEVVHVFPVKKGGPPQYQKCQYELIRDQIIADREALMREVLADIQKSSREIVEENEKSKKRKATDQGKAKKEKKRKVERVVDTGGARRSARERKPVNYCAIEDMDDPDWEPGEKKKKVERKRKRRDGSNDHIKDRKPLPPDWKPFYHHLNNPFERKDGEDGAGTSSSSDKSDDDKDADSAERGGRSMRARKFVNYNFDGPRADEFVFCERCGEEKYHGCEIHPLIFDYVAHFDVGPSKVGKNAGRGVFNNDFRGDIPEGVMFGPYDGIFYTPKEYDSLKKTRGESGYAWELKDPDKIKVIGYVDPGPNPNPLKQWMSIVNCANKTRHQNLMPGQFIGGIYYRSMETIHFGTELLVYYGNDYARDIKIKVEERDFYELHEDWEEEGVSCPHCGRGYVKQEFLQKHFDLVESSAVGGCKEVRREKNRAEVLAGLRPHVCGECGKGFKEASKLNLHKATHSDAKPFVCHECGKSYKTQNSLRKHIKADHEGHTYDCPECERPFKQKCHMRQHWIICSGGREKEFKCAKCGQKFNRNEHLTDHIKSVHNREKPFKCEVCGQRFSRKQNLKQHILDKHENARPYVCEDCGAAYKHAQSLDHHRIKEHTHQFYWNCDVCNAQKIEMGFLLPVNLKKHMLKYHPEAYQKQIEEEKPAVCPKCQKRFPSEEQVAIHLKKMHNNE